MNDDSATLPELDEAGFIAAKAATGSALLVEYFADHCVWCARLEPLLVAAQAEFGERVRIVKLNVERYPSSLPDGGLRATPTIAMFRNGHHIASKTGMVQRAALKAFIEHWLDPANEGLASA